MRARTSAADLMTIANGLCGFVALAALAGLWLESGAAGGELDHDTLVTCLLLYGIGMVFDVLDGPVARWRGSSGLGPTLDTISDTITFGLLPALLLVASVEDDAPWRALTLLGAAVYVGATMLRLARHVKAEADEQAAAAVAGTKPGRHAFSGMPSPVGGNCVLALVVLTPPAPVVVIGVAVVGFLLVADFPYPNDTSFGAVFVGVLLLLSFAGIAGLISLDIPAAVALAGLLPIAIVRVVAGWTQSLRRETHHPRTPSMTLGTTDAPR
jgi:CDP-diacylglycerol---serine O-phosphatidyltransferase